MWGIIVFVRRCCPGVMIREEQEMKRIAYLWTEGSVRTIKMNDKHNTLRFKYAMNPFSSQQLDNLSLLFYPASAVVSFARVPLAHSPPPQAPSPEGFFRLRLVNDDGIQSAFYDVIRVKRASL